MSRHPIDLVLTTFLAGIACFFTLVMPGVLVLRLLLGLPFVLIFPGYALTAALFPRNNLKMSERFLLSIGMSFVTSALGGLVLNWTPWGLQTCSWAGLLFGVIFITSIVAALRRKNETESATMPIHLNLDLQKLLLMGMAGVMVVSAIGLSRLPVSLQNRQEDTIVAKMPIGGSVFQTPEPSLNKEGYTILWMLPPVDAATNVIHLGVTSMEFTSMTCDLQLVRGSQVIQEWPSLSFTSGEKWETSVILSREDASAESVRLVLYRQDTPGVPYRQVQFQPTQ